MGQLLSSEEESSQLREAIGSLFYGAILEGGAVPDLGVVHPLLGANHDHDKIHLQEKLPQVNTPCNTQFKKHCPAQAKQTD